MTQCVKYAFFLAAVMALSVLPAASRQGGELSLDLISSSYTIKREGEYDVIAMDGFYTRGIPGTPLLPQKVYDVKVPSTAELDTVHMEILSKEKENLPGFYAIGPSPLVTNGYFHSTSNLSSDVYTTDALYPDFCAQILRTYQVKEKKYVRILFSPFQYNPVSKTLVLNRKVTVTISWTTASKKLMSPKAAGTGYVIVTTNAVLNNSVQLASFVTFLQLRGFSVYIVTETQYGAATGQQRAVNIRNWLKANYALYNVKYVLLIGNPDPDDPATADTYGDVPMMMCWPNPATAADQTPTDYFYADLTGDWNSDGDTMYGEFGEDGVDFGPEVYVGRIPVYGGNYTVLDSILNKFINFTGANTSIMMPMAISNYQDEENTTNGCVAGWLRTDGLNLPQEVVQNITGPAGFTDFIMYETGGVVGRGHDPVSNAAFGFKTPLTNSNVISQWANDYGLVFWWGHGSQTAVSRKYWLNDLNTNFIVEDGGCAASDELAWVNFLSSADTGLLPDMETFVVQASCLNGYPENSNNLQYSLLKKGAVSTVGSTRYCWYAQGTWTFTGIVDNASIGYMYVGNAVYWQSSGEALYNGKNTLVNIWGWQGWQNLFDFNLYGDPSMYLEGPLVKPPEPPPPNPPPQNPAKQMCPVANHHIDKAQDLLEEARDLLEKAKSAEKDVSEIEAKIGEAEEILEKARRYCLGHNCIAGNYWALKTIEMLTNIIKQLKAMV